MTNYLRQPGTIKRVFIGHEDHNIPTVLISIEFEGSAQGFGNLALHSLDIAEDFLKDVCATFGIDVAGAAARPSVVNDHLIGRSVIACRCWDWPTADIEGLEDPTTGNRFTLTDWRRKHWPDTTSPLEDQARRLDNEIVRLRQKIVAAQSEKARLAEKYHPVAEVRK